MKIKIGTRKSKLALIQTDMVIKSIKSLFPNIETEIIHISTKGDKILDKPLSTIGGKGIFVSEIENMLQNNEIDLAVHSAKDLPVELGNGLEISGVLKRGNYRDAIILRHGETIDNANNFIVGTGSIRRKLNLQRHYPNVSFKNIRGNVDTRIKKLLDGEYNAIILAMAGLERLNMDKNSQYDVYPFEYTDFLPSPCQGIIAIESKTNSPIKNIIQEISDKNTFLQFETERHILKLLNADCNMPVGAYSQIKNNKILLIVSTYDKIVNGNSEISERFKIAEELITKL